MCVRTIEWKGTFLRADWVTQFTHLGYLNQQTCEKGYASYRHLEWIVSERLIFHSLRYLNRQTCEKGYVFTKISNRLVSKRVIFYSLILKRVCFFFRPRDHSKMVAFQRPGRTCFPRNIWVLPHHKICWIFEDNFLQLAIKKYMLWVLIRNPIRRGINVYPQQMC